MNRTRARYLDRLGLMVAVFMLLAGWLRVTAESRAKPGARVRQGPANLDTTKSSAVVPMFQVDAAWPKPLPNHWVLGAVIGAAVDSHDHIWITHRGRGLQPDYYMALITEPPSAECCQTAPPVLEFDQAGNLVRSWGGPGEGYEWPESEHGIFVDQNDNVWLGGNSGVGTPVGDAGKVVQDTHILKFTKEGKFLLQIGKKGRSGGNSDTENMQHPSSIFVDAASQEVFVTDGEWGGSHRGNFIGNERVIVFDANNGKFKRMWGAYGKKPVDEKVENYTPDKPDNHTFRGPHGVKISKDGLVYIADRGTNRVQVFQKDGTFVKEAFVAQKTLYPGAVWDVGLSADPKQEYLYVADGLNKRIWILRRESLEILGRFGTAGRGAGQLYLPHNVVADSKGNLYVTDTLTGARVQKFLYKGLGKGSLD